MGNVRFSIPHFTVLRMIEFSFILNFLLKLKLVTNGKKNVTKSKNSHIFRKYLIIKQLREKNRLDDTKRERERIRLKYKIGSRLFFY